jgi:hypothetical protein
MNIKTFSRVVWLAIFLCFFTARPAFAGAVVGYYYTGFLNGSIAIQMDLRWNSTDINGEYQYVATGHYLDLNGSIASPTSTVCLRENNLNNYAISSGSFTGKFSERRCRFTGLWRGSDGKRTFPFSLRAVAEYRSLTKTIKLSAEEEADRKRSGKTPDCVITEVFPYFYNANSSLSILNRKLRNAAVDELSEAGNEKEGELTDLGTNCRIDYKDENLVSLTYTTTNEGGAHNLYGIVSENHLIAGSKPITLNLNDLLTSSKKLRSHLLNRVRTNALKLAEANSDHGFDSDVPWKDISFSLNAKRITFRYPCEIGSLGSYDVQLSYDELAPYLAKKSVVNSLWNAPAASTFQDRSRDARVKSGGIPGGKE